MIYESAPPSRRDSRCGSNPRARAKGTRMLCLHRPLIKRIMAMTAGKRPALCGFDVWRIPLLDVSERRERRSRIVTDKPPQPDMGEKIKEANAMSKEPIYRIKVEVIGTEDEEHKINETLRGGRV